MTQSNKITAMIAAAIVGTASIGTASAAPAAAAQNRDVPSIVVKYAAATLATDRGARQVYRRLVAASEAVCPAPISGSRFVSPVIEACRSQALERAVRQIDDARLAALYAGSSKQI